MLSRMISFINSDIHMSTTVIFGGLGILLVNLSGMTFIGCEGIMLVAALMAVIGTYIFGSVWLGLLLAMFSGAVLGLLFAFLCVTLHSDQVVVGTAFNILGTGISAMLYRVFFGVSTNLIQVESFQTIELPLLSKLPYIGTILSQNALVYIAFFLVPVLSFFLYRTSTGLNLRAVGENPKAVDTLGIDVYKMQYGACILGSVIMAMGGAYYSTGLLSYFAEGMISGRGFISIAAVIFGKYKPKGVLIASLIFMGGNVVANMLQAGNSVIPYYFLVMIPYVLTIIALAGFAGNTSVPAALGKSYKKE